VNLLLFSLLALAATQDPPPAAAQASDAPPTHAEALASFPRRLADRPLAIGAGLFEASFNASWQFNSTLGFGEIPYARYGLSSMWEVDLVGIRMIVAEDGQYIPGLAFRLQLHDLAYQHDDRNPFSYPILRPGAFIELRDRFPNQHLAVNLSAGYYVNVQSDPNLSTGERVNGQFFPINLKIQYSPLEWFSVLLGGSVLDDIGHPYYTTYTLTQWGASLTAVWVPKSWLDVQAFFKANWYDGSLGFVPEVGLGATIRL